MWGVPLWGWGLWVVWLVVVTPLAVHCGRLIERRTPRHVHDWTRWEPFEGTLTRTPVFGSGTPTVIECTLQQRSCHGCGTTETERV